MLQVLQLTEPSHWRPVVKQNSQERLWEPDEEPAASRIGSAGAAVVERLGSL